MLAIVDGRPETLGLKQIIKHHIDFQFELATRKYTTLLNKELENKEIKEGLIRACNIIDLIIEILRGSRNLKMAKECLISGNVEGISFKSEKSKKDAAKLHFTERQASAILELRLYKLIGLEILALEKEYEETLARIAEYEDILNSRRTMVKVIKKDLDNIKKEYALPRRTVVEDAEEAVFEEQKMVEQEVVFLMDRFGYAKTIDTAAYERNKEAAHAENKYVFNCMNTDKICIFTDNGNLHQIKVKDIPFVKFRDKGTPIDNLGNYSSAGEEIIFLCCSSLLAGRKLLFTTKKAMMKLVDGAEFDVSKRTVAATKLSENDLITSIEIISAVNTQNVVLQTENGYFLKFMLEEIPEKKKSAVGVRGMKIDDKDAVDEVYLIPEDADISIQYKDKDISLKKLKLSKRDAKGQKR